MKTEILNLLLIIFTVLLIYCIMYNFYNPKLISNNNNNNNNNKEKFDNSLISIDNARKNIADLENVKKYLTNYENMLKQTKTKINEQELEINNLLSNKYMLHYLDSIDKGNAMSYKEFLMYQNPAENKIYKSYL